MALLVFVQTQIAWRNGYVVALCNKLIIIALLLVGKIFGCRILYRPSIWLGQYCHPQTEYFPILLSQLCNDYTKSIVGSLCVSNGRSAEMTWPCETRGFISNHWEMEARTSQSLWVTVKALTTGTDTTFLDRLHKNQAKVDTCSGLQLRNLIHKKILPQFR